MLNHELLRGHCSDSLSKLYQRADTSFHHCKVDYIIMQSNQLWKKPNQNFLMVTKKSSKFLQSTVKTFHEFTKFYFMNFWNVVADTAAPPIGKAMTLSKSGMILPEYLVIISQGRFQTKTSFSLSDWLFTSESCFSVLKSGVSGDCSWNAENVPINDALWTTNHRSLSETCDNCDGIQMGSCQRRCWGRFSNCIRLSDWLLSREHQFENPFEPLLKRMKKNVNIIKRACLFVQQQKNIKSLQSYCSSQVKSQSFSVDVLAVLVFIADVCSLSVYMDAVSYTHLTLPTNREV